MHNYIFDAATNGLLLQAEEINPAPGSMCFVLKSKS